MLSFLDKVVTFIIAAIFCTQLWFGMYWEAAELLAEMVLLYTMAYMLPWALQKAMGLK